MLCVTEYPSGTMTFITRNRKLNRIMPPLTTLTVQRESCFREVMPAPLHSPDGPTQLSSAHQLWPKPAAWRLLSQKSNHLSDDREETPLPKAPSKSQLDSTGSDTHYWTSDHGMCVDGSLKERLGHEVQLASSEANGQCGTRQEASNENRRQHKNLRSKHHCVKIIL